MTVKTARSIESTSTESRLDTSVFYAKGMPGYWNSELNNRLSRAKTVDQHPRIIKKWEADRIAYNRAIRLLQGELDVADIVYLAGVIQNVLDYELVKDLNYREETQLKNTLENFKNGKQLQAENKNIRNQIAYLIIFCEEKLRQTLDKNWLA
jgi:hypothetical protein